MAFLMGNGRMSPFAGEENENSPFWCEILMLFLEAGIWKAADLGSGENLNHGEPQGAS